MLFNIKRFELRLWWGVLTLLLVVLFVHLGRWQYQKAQVLIARQQAFLSHDIVQFPHWLPTKELKAWQNRKVKVRGHYEPQYQFLLDNQVMEDRAGYHVLTPFKISNSEQYILINRGWVEAQATHSVLPTVDVPSDNISLEGWIKLPSRKIFTLEHKLANPVWHRVWQSLDMDEYIKLVPFPVVPAVILLDANSSAGGGFVRHWEAPQERIVMHLGYAYQWFGFAVSSLLIYLYSSIKRMPIESRHE